MAGGWRRLFCTSVHKDLQHEFDNDDADADADADRHRRDHLTSSKLTSRFGFLSNPSSPRVQSWSSFSPNLRCKTTTEKTSPASAPVSPKLHCKTSKSSPRFFFRSNPSSPKSPSSFSFLLSKSRFSKSRCGICSKSVKTGQGTAIYTAECSHPFHYPCIVSEKNLICPVCSTQWSTLPHLDLNQTSMLSKSIPKSEHLIVADKEEKRETVTPAVKNLKVYNDDEPLLSPVAGRGFVAIPESNEEEISNVDELQHHATTNNIAAVSPIKIDLKFQPDAAAVVAVNRSFETRVVVLTVKPPSSLSEIFYSQNSSPQQYKSNRAPIDLVAVINVSNRVSDEKQQSMKKAMRFVISSLSCNDRLSIVVFSDTSKRLMPLKKMTATGRRSARRMVDVLGCIGHNACASDAVKKATKVLEDRHEKNHFSTVLLLSDGQDDFTCSKSSNRNRPFFSVHKFDFSEAHAPSIDNAFTKRFREMINPTVQDLRFELELKSIAGLVPAQVTAVYTNQAGQPTVSEPGSIKMGDLYVENQERDLLIELKVPMSAGGRTHHVLTVRSSYKDPSSQKLVICKDQSLLVPEPSVKSSSSKIERLRFYFIATRAVAESRKLSERKDLSGAYHLLNSARALLMRSHSSFVNEYLRGLEAELGELNLIRNQEIENQRLRLIDSAKKGGNGVYVDEKGEALTPTSAWKAAERLAKVAVMRKSLNRVGDLHGFENARF